MSTVKTDAIETRAGGTSVLTIGTATQTIKLPGGTPGADKVLTSDADGDATWEDAAAGGLTHASQWRLTTSFTGLATPITLNLEQVDAPVGFGVLGSSMTEASGIFTFPSTGYWRIDYQQANDPTTVQGGSLSIFTTTNDSTYVAASVGFWNGNYDNSGAQTSYIMDVTNTTTHKVQFHVNWNSGSATQTTLGSTDIDYTYMTFLRLADT